MSKVAPKISPVGRSKMPTSGAHNPNVGTHGSGLAPKPSTSQPRLSQTTPSAGEQGGIARVQNVGGAKAAGSDLPVKSNAMRGLANDKVGQPNPNTSAAATKKPKRKGIGSSFYGEY